MKRIISPEIERVVKQSTLSLNGEDGNVIFVKWREYEIASGVRTYGMLPKVPCEQGRSDKLRWSL